MEVRWSQSSRRHRIGRVHARHVMSTVEPTGSVMTAGSAALLWIGTEDGPEEMKMAKKTIRINDVEVTDGGSIDLDVEDVRMADGTRLTEAGARELAEQVLRTSSRGRPSLTAPGERSPQLRLTVPEQLRDGLRARADAEHRSVSELAREAIERYLAS